APLDLLPADPGNGTGAHQTGDLEPGAAHHGILQPQGRLDGGRCHRQAEKGQGCDKCCLFHGNHSTDVPSSSVKRPQENLMAVKPICDMLPHFHGATYHRTAYWVNQTMRSINNPVGSGLISPLTYLSFVFQLLISWHITSYRLSKRRFSKEFLMHATRSELLSPQPALFYQRSGNEVELIEQADRF